MLVEFLHNLLDLLLETAIWLLFGLILAAILKGWIPTALVERWLSGRGIGSVIRAALIGAPLPLCSCGVLPTAIGLRRSGASKPATVSFLVATPETGVDSISVTYALLGPVMAIIRPVSAITSAIISGLMVLFFDTDSQLSKTSKPHTSSNCCSTAQAPEPESTSGCCSKTAEPLPQSGCCDSKTETTTGSCCATISATSQAPAATKPGLLAGLHFAVVDILDDISKWLAIGLVLAAIVATLVEPAGLSQWGSGLTAMLLMLIVGLPLYICATASTPLAAALLAAGMSPGAVLVFLLVGPATNIASLGILSRELGIRAVALYLAGISLCAIALGLLTDAVLGNLAIASAATTAHEHGGLFGIMQWIAALLLLILAIRPLRQRIWPLTTVSD